MRTSTFAFLFTALLGGTASAGVDAFDAGLEHACAVNDCQDAQCWGYNDHFGEVSDVAGPFVDIAVGMDHTCALDPGGLPVCWGRADDDRLEPEYDDFVDIEAGGGFTCGIRNNGEVACWGRGGDDPDVIDPLYSATYGPPKQKVYGKMSLGYDYGCAITSGKSTIYCWGAQIPGGQAVLSRTALLDPAERFQDVSAGYKHLCFTSTTGRVGCMGSNLAYQLTPDRNPSNPRQPGPQIGRLMTSQLENDVVLEWFSYGDQLGEPIYSEVSAGLVGTCAVYRNPGSAVDKTHCWGFPFSFGYGRSLPLSVEPEIVDLGGHQFCGWDTDATGAIDCRWESPAYEVIQERMVPELEMCQ